MTKGGSVILRIYFSLVSFVTLMILVFSVSDLVNLTLKTYLFPAADQPSYTVYCDPSQTAEMCDRQQRDAKEQALVQKQQDAVRDLSLLIVSAPMFWMHFRIVYRDWMEEKNKKEA
ncbi:hypothetical protein EPO34_02190 [Patescibacteria group bacterium]|nr:MAG: hypothetical protein EPO34_02190 [Patescibacteria group bacterium]